MRRRGRGLAIVVLFVATALASTVSPATAKSGLYTCKASQFAPPITQPPPIMSDFTFKNDMFCNIGNLPLIRVGKNGITINLAHHLIDGNGQGVGIDDQGHKNVTIKNGVISNFDTGVAISGKNVTLQGMTIVRNVQDGVQVTGQKDIIKNNLVASNGNNGINADLASPSTVSITNNEALANSANGVRVGQAPGGEVVSNTITGNDDDGIFVVSSSNGLQIKKNIVTASGLDGVFVTGSTGVALTKNTAKGNDGNGLRIDSGDGAFTNNIASENGTRGIFADNSASTINGNVADRNGFFNGTSNSSLGIDGPIATGTDNTAIDNADSAQCSNTLCPGAIASTPFTLWTCGDALGGADTLSNNLSCTASDGLVVSTGGQHVELGPHRIEGDGTHDGVYLGASSTSVHGGFVRNFDVGFDVDGVVAVTDVTIDGGIASQNASGGVEMVTGNDNSTVVNTTAVDNGGNGIEAVGPIAGLTIQDSRAIASHGSNFDQGGIVVSDAPSATIKGNLAVANGNDGILVSGASPGTKVKNANASDNFGYGIENSSSDVTVSNSKAYGNDFTGIYFDDFSQTAPFGKILNSTANGNGDDGITLETFPTVSGNTANTNGFTNGIATGDTGLGISGLFPPPNTPGSGNSAHGNDDTTEHPQCIPKHLCT